MYLNHLLQSLVGVTTAITSSTVLWPLAVSRRLRRAAAIKPASHQAAAINR